jgi:hypothetical protein
MIQKRTAFMRKSLSKRIPGILRDSRELRARYKMRQMRRPQQRRPTSTRFHARTNGQALLPFPRETKPKLAIPGPSPHYETELGDAYLADSLQVLRALRTARSTPW